MLLITTEFGGGEGMDSTKRRLLEIFRRTSFRSSDEPVFRLASGKLSRYYVDCKQALSDPEARLLIGNLIFQLVKDESLDSVGGLELGAYPIATSVSDTIFLQAHRVVRAFVIRKAPKSHGVGDLVAGHIEKGDKTLIVDDVVTTGGSTIKAIRGAREAGLCVQRAIVLVDREEDYGRKNIEAEGVRFDALFTLSELRKLNNECCGENADAYREGPVREQSGRVVIAR
jgi:orotate phosphoribosyltransferase